MINNSSIIRFWKSLTLDQAKDVGTALVLLMLVAGYFFEMQIFYKLAIPLLLAVLIIPACFYPFALIWFGLSKILGFIMSKIILTIIFLFVVCPIGLFRKLLGKDLLHLKEFKKCKKSVFVNRECEFEANDIEKPF